MSGGPTGSVVLSLYERGMTADPARRAALLCAAAGGNADWPLGEVDRSIWRWLSEAADRPFEAVMTCTACGEAVEFTLPEGFDLPGGHVDTVQVPFGGTVHSVRMPTLVDLGSHGLEPTRLAPEAPWQDVAFQEAAEAALEAADPGLKVTLALECDACGAAQDPVFDVPGFAWGHVEAAARRLVRDIARLAAAFGWSEAEIAEMRPARRALYLQEIAS